MTSIEDVKSFRLTCKQTGEALATEVLRHITININAETSERELAKLQYLASTAEASSSHHSKAIQGIRQLDIRSLSPVLHSKALEASAEGDAAAAKALKYYEEQLKKCLFNALSSLTTTVRTVRCVFFYEQLCFRVSFMIA